MIETLKTDQQRSYERAYSSVAGDYGMPDRKIADGKELQGKKILALGCGAAQDIWYLTKSNEVYGVDYANSGLEVARDHGVKVQSGDLNSEPLLPFDDEFFDIVVCKDILEHLLDPLAVIREVKRVMKRTGYVIVSVPNHFCLPMRLRIFSGAGILYHSVMEDHRREYDEWNYMHIRFFTYAGLKRFFRIAGIAPEKWFWDFGNLAHYHQPEMWLEPQIWKKAHGQSLSRRGNFGLYVLGPAWKVFNVIFPRKVRRALVALAPGLLCAGFYVRCRAAEIA